jgi:alkanesulfonate monooxygenase SsuD/methylene tetrahydromethanopterin reductase-like flavin-dependent oxidoreductase (luciferase family)
VPVRGAGDVLRYFYRLRKFRLGVDPAVRRPKIIVGALGEQMLRLAGELTDGVLLNYLPASQVPWCAEQVRRGGGATIYANVHVGVGDRDTAASQARRDLFSHAVVDACARSFTRAGFGDHRRAKWPLSTPPCRQPQHPRRSSLNLAPYGAIAMATGSSLSLIALPALFVLVLMRVTSWAS